MSAGSHNGSISLSASGATNSPVTIALRLDLTPPRAVEPGLWTGALSGGRSLSFRASSSGVIDQLAVRIIASLFNGSCTAVFTGTSAGVQVANSTLLDSVSHPAISLSRRVPVNGTFASAARLTGNVGGYSGSLPGHVRRLDHLWHRYVMVCNDVQCAPDGQSRDTVAFNSALSVKCMRAGSPQAARHGAGGRISFGQLGNGTTTPVSNPTPSPVSGGLVFPKLSTNGRTNTCGITTAGATWCWGNGSSGRSRERHDRRQSRAHTSHGEHRVAQLATGTTHSCALTADGTAYCWGYNVRGQLGDSSTTDRSSPVPVKTSLKLRRSPPAASNSRAGLRSAVTRTAGRRA